MWIAVTGASGFVGPRVIAGLAEKGHTGYAISRREMINLPEGWSWLPRAQVLNGEILGRGNRAPPDWSIHLEVKQHVAAPTERDRAEFQRVNVDGTREWLAWCTRVGVEKFAYFSTIKAVGESKTCQDETSDSAPSTPYGASKRRGEELIRSWVSESSQRHALILRPAVIYGPGNRANIYSMVQAINRGMFFLVGRNENVKSMISVTNVAAAVCHLLERSKPGVDVFNLVDGTNHTVRDIAQIVARQLGKSERIRSLPLGGARFAAGVAEVLKRGIGIDLPLSRSRLNALLETTHFSSRKLLETGFVHPQTTEQGLAEMVAWYRSMSGKAES